MLTHPTFARTSGMVACFSPDGRFLASADQEGAKLWDWRTSRPIALLGIGRTNGVAFHPADGRLLTWSNGDVQAWPIASDPESVQAGWQVGPPVRLGKAGPGDRACLSADGRKFARANPDQGLVIVSDLEAANDRLVLGPHAGVTNVALSPDGRWAATSAFGTGAIGQSVKVWDLRAGTLVLDLPRDIVSHDTAVAFSPDNRWLVTGTDREYRLWQVGSWFSERIFPREHAGRAPMAFTRDASILAIGATDRSVRVVDVNTGLELVSLATTDARRIYSLCFSPDDTQLAAGCDGQIQVWDLRYLRHELSTMGLDWQADPYPPSSPSGPLPSGQGRVLLGRLDDPVTNQPVAILAQNANNEVRNLATNSDPLTRDVSRAVEWAEKAVQWEPANSLYWNTIGVALYRTGRWRDAIAAHEKSEELAPGRSYGFNAFFLAMADWQLGEKEQAKKWFGQAVQWMAKNKPKDQDLIRFRAEGAELLGIAAKRD